MGLQIGVGSVQNYTTITVSDKLILEYGSTETFTSENKNISSPRHIMRGWPTMRRETLSRMVKSICR